MKNRYLVTVTSTTVYEVEVETDTLTAAAEQAEANLLTNPDANPVHTQTQVAQVKLLVP